MNLSCLLGFHDWHVYDVLPRRSSTLEELLAGFAFFTLAVIPLVIVTFGLGLFFVFRTVHNFLWAEDKTCLRCGKHVYDCTQRRDELALRQDRIEIAEEAFNESKEDLGL